MWGAFGIGCLAGGLSLNALRRVRQEALLVTIIAGWALAMLALAAAPTVPLAVLVFGLGGLIWAPFTPVAYSLVQSALTPEEQPPVVTLWAAGGTLAAPIGLALGGPLVELAEARGSLLISALLTLALVPWAAWGLRRAPAARRVPEPARPTS